MGPRIVQMVRLAAMAGLLVASMVLVTVGGGAVVLRDGLRAALTMPAGFDPTGYARESVILDADGGEIARVRDKNREAVRLGQVAPVMREAVVAVEDRRFYEHRGVAPLSVFRAALATLAGDTQGGSTITQQYVKNVLLDAADTPEDAAEATETTLARKIKELRLAIGVESSMGKDEILEGYLNISYFGNDAYGVQAAAERYFGVSAEELDTVQAATLAGLVKGPSLYDPIEHPDAAVQRRNTVLEVMGDTGALSEAEAKNLMDDPLELDPVPSDSGCYESDRPFFCTYVVAWVESDPRFGDGPEERSRWLRRSGVEVHTTLDPRTQKAAQEAVDRHVPEGADAGKVAAVAAVEPGTGAVRALAQNRGHGFGGEEAGSTTSVNFAVDAEYGGSGGFQAGSVFKAYTVAAALDGGLSASTTFATPEKAAVTGQETCEGTALKEWGVRGAGGGTARQDMIEALRVSSNTYFAQLQQKVGLCSTVRMAEALGVRRADGDPLGQWNSFTLGDQEVSPIAVAESYATLAARGRHCTSVPVASIVSDAGERTIDPHCERALGEVAADAANHVLQAPLSEGGTAEGLGIGRPAAGKTGTTDDSASAWFAGHTPSLAAAVAVGDPRGGATHPLTDVTIGGRFYSSVHGATLPGPIWQDTMQGALEGQKKQDFPDPLDRYLHPRSGTHLLGADHRSGASVPDVAGLTMKEAAARLDDAGFEATTGSVSLSSPHPSGHAATTNPSAGTPLPEGAVVKVFAAR